MFEGGLSLPFNRRLRWLLSGRLCDCRGLFARPKTHSKTRVVRFCAKRKETRKEGISIGSRRIKAREHGPPFFGNDIFESCFNMIPTLYYIVSNRYYDPSKGPADKTVSLVLLTNPLKDHTIGFGTIWFNVRTTWNNLQKCRIFEKRGG